MKESQNIEWKESWKDEYLKWICGFANADGGVLYIGKNDVGEIVGLENGKRLLQDIPNKVRDVLGIMVDVNFITEIPDGEFLEIAVDPYPYPVSYKGQYHYRSGSTKQELKGAAPDKFLLRKQGKRWDGVPVPGVQVNELDLVALEHFRDRAVKSKRLSFSILSEDNTLLIEKLHLMESGYLKRAALLLFYPDPEHFITGAFIKIGFFKTNSELLYHDEIHGSLFSQINKAMDLLLSKYQKAVISYDGLQRVETYPVPEEALREALLNAVAHKDYSSGVPVQISVYEHQIVFWNNGQLHEGWTTETLKNKHPSQPYNPDVANVLFRAGMIESWGRGIEKMMDVCTNQGVAVPQLRYETGGLWVTFAYNHPGTELLDKTLGEKLGEKLGENRMAILDSMRKSPEITIVELAKHLKISTTAVEKNIRFLKERKFIQRIGAAKGGYWQILK